MSEGGPPGAPTPTQTTNPGRPDLATRLKRLQGLIAGPVGRLRRLKGPIIAIAAVGAVLSGFVGYWNAYRTVRESVVPVAKSQKGTEPPALSVAILPFDTARASIADDHLGETLRSDVAIGIARGIRSGKVVSEGLVAPYKNKAVDARSAGRDLNVRYLITGDIRSAGEQTVVNVQLVETVDGTQVWSDRLELPPHRDVSDEATLASSLALRLRGVIYQAERRRVKSTAGSPEASAMDLVLRADALLFNSEGQSYREARRLYDEALRMDPGLAAALIGRAWTFDHELWNDPRADTERLVREFERDSARAVDLDPRDALSWSMRETALAWLGQRDAAKQANAMARQLDPMSKMLLSDAAWETILDGEPDKGIAFLAQARAIDPNVEVHISWTTCFLEVYRNNYPIAVPFCEKAVLLYPGWWLQHAFLTAALAQSNNAQKAAQSKAALLKLKPDFSIRGYSPILTRLSADPEYRRLTEERLIAGLRKAGVPE
jgi:adenylate cyclase